MDVLTLLAQAEPPSSFDGLPLPPGVFRDLFNLGAVGAILLFIGALVWRYLPKLIDGVLGYMHITAACAEENAKVNKTMGDSLKVLTDTQGALLEAHREHTDPVGAKFRDHVFSTVHTNKALSHLSLAMQSLIHDHPAKEQAGPHIQRALDALKNLPGHTRMYEDGRD